MNLKRFSIPVLLLMLLLTLTIAYSVLAQNYSTADPGYITGTEIQLNHGWYSRPGLDTFPDPSSSPGPYSVQAQLADDHPFTSIGLNYGQPGGGTWGEMTMANVGGELTGEIPEIDPAAFNYCQLNWPYSFYLHGYGTEEEDDERHYEPLGTGGDPYLFQIANPNPNQLPVADPGGPYRVNRWEPFNLNGSASFDTRGPSVTYEWDIYVTWPDFESSPYYVMDDNFSDGSGPNPVITLDENGEYHVRLRVTDECGEESIVETTIMVYDPHVVVIPQDNHIAALNWREGLTLTLEINGEFVDAKPAEFLNEGDLFGTNFQMDEYDIQVVPGMNVTIYGDEDTSIIGDEIVRSHVVRNHTIQNVDTESETVTGWAQPGTYVRVRIEDPWVEIVAGAGGDGTWLADFSLLDPPVDITPITWINVIQQNDDDSSHTVVYWVPPVFDASLTYNWIDIRHFTSDSNISVAVFEYQGGPPIPDTPISVPTDDGGFAWFDGNEYGIDLQPGMYVVLTDEAGQTKGLELANISLDVLDPEHDVVSGTAPDGAWLQVDAGNESGGQGMEVQATGGNWVADFGAQGFDITPDMGSQARLFDDDGDATVAEPAPRPVLHARPSFPEVHGHDWPSNAYIWLTITRPSSGDTYTAEKPVNHEPLEFCDNPCFDLRGVWDLELGDIVSMEDDQGHSLTVHVTALKITAVDLAADTVSGTAEPYTDVWVFATDWDPPRHEIAGADGNWTADFSVAGDEEFEQGTIDLVPGVGWRAIQFENDYSDDGTLEYWPVPPNFVDGSVTPNPVMVGSEVTISADFIGFTYDSSVSSSSIVSMEYLIEGVTNWTSMPLEGSASLVTGTATLSIGTPGVYPVVARAFDAAGWESGGFLGFLVVYDPDGGFVTGGGWIWSPRGAYYPDPALEGKATFGFVSKYKKGASVPTGQTEFQFKVGNLNFHSSSYDWLVIAGTKAMYKGTGTINGMGEYGFMLSAIDGTPDKFRIKIWDKATETVIYDNQLGEMEDAEPATELGGGSIVVHKK